ncbi:hypothetical protein JCM19301_3278 [Jejuia pallidilutea]|uniref:Uncharacterized protein n=1 Tax=Jejuia pallidilutea TaxID=504487 RepID=A0A090VVD8_9FLAO|nr:hypothetical protein JCM19301_3278 [Jejuia pallidilutea]GAL72264.1 hypothetical protein JCM19302_9 [Jejuia pallidilutea]
MQFFAPNVGLGFPLVVLVPRYPQQKLPICLLRFKKHNPKHCLFA